MGNSHRNIKYEDIVNEENIRDAKRLEDDPEAILRLIDLLFIGYDETKIVPS